jgi:polar amino acid transport system substrate-binding protein
MDEIRIERALRQGPPDEAVYEPRLRPSSFPGRARRRQADGHRPGFLGRALPVAAALVIAIALAGVLWLRHESVIPVAATPSPSVSANPSGAPSPTGRSDLLDQVRSSGALRMAIRPDFPQASILGLEGFDVDVATELARRLSLGAYPVQVAVADMLAGASGDPWDLAFPSAVVTAAAASRFAASTPYYYWPTYLVVPKVSGASSPADLGGATFCTVGGSSGAGWLSGALDPGSGASASPPAGPTVRTEATDWACLDALAAGDVEAVVTAALSDSDLAARPSLRTVGGPILVEPRAIVAARTGLDPSALLSVVDNALGAMRSDGTLADLSRKRFGGRDLTTPPSP